MAKNEKNGDEMSAADSGSANSGRGSKSQQKWYSEGLRFECTQCGACCSGEPGYVWVEQSEIAAMAGELNMSVDAFERKFVRDLGYDKSLIEYPDGDCILLDPDTRKCTVYESGQSSAVHGHFGIPPSKNRKTGRRPARLAPVPDRANFTP